MTQKKITLKEIAKRTGVSLATVHRAIYGKDGLSEETRRKILDEVEKCHYQVDEAASALKRGTKTVFVVLPKAQKEDRFFLASIWNGIRQAAKEMEQYRIQFHYIESECRLSEMYMELERVYDRYLDEMDGLITLADSEEAGIWLSRFLRRGIYCVQISSYYLLDDSKLACIKMDHAMCGKLAAEYLSMGLKKPHGKVLVYNGDKNVYSNRIYAENFTAEMKKEGHEIIEIAGFGRDQIEEQTMQCLESQDIDGIFICNARNTYSVCRILEEKYQGKDMIVVGTDIFEELDPFFKNGILNAVICQYQWEQGVQAVKFLQEYLIKGVLEEQDIILTPVLLMKANYTSFLDK